MRLFGAGVLIGSLLFTTGCTTLLETMLDDSSREEGIELQKGEDKILVASTLNQTAERRNIIFSLNEDGGLVTCAEQPPDVAISKELTDSLVLALTNASGQQQVDINSTLKEALKLLTTRTVALEMLRVTYFANCLAVANGHIGEEEFRAIHTKLVEAVAQRILNDDDPPPPSS